MRALCKKHFPGDLTVDWRMRGACSRRAGERNAVAVKRFRWPSRSSIRTSEALDELCAGVLRDPQDKALAEKLVRVLAALESPLAKTGRGEALDNALARASFIFASWRPLIEKGSVNAAAWAGELRTALFNVKSELAILRRLLGL